MVQVALRQLLLAALPVLAVTVLRELLQPVRLVAALAVSVRPDPSALLQSVGCWAPFLLLCGSLGRHRWLAQCFVHKTGECSVQKPIRTEFFRLATSGASSVSMG